MHLLSRIILSGLLVGTFFVDALAQGIPTRRSCPSGMSCCAQPVFDDAIVLTKAGCGVKKAAARPAGPTTCCHPQPRPTAGSNHTVIALTSIPAPHSIVGSEGLSDPAIVLDQLSGRFRGFSEPAPPHPMDIPIYLLTLTLLC